MFNCFAQADAIEFRRIGFLLTVGPYSNQTCRRSVGAMGITTTNGRRLRNASCFRATNIRVGHSACGRRPFQPSIYASRLSQNDSDSPTPDWTE